MVSPPGFDRLGGAIGFEPTTLWSQTRCATRLRYAPTRAILCPAAGGASCRCRNHLEQALQFAGLRSGHRIHRALALRGEVHLDLPGVLLAALSLDQAGC